MKTLSKIKDEIAVEMGFDLNTSPADIHFSGYTDRVANRWRSELYSNWETEPFNYGIQVLLAEKPMDKSLLKAIEELNELSVKLLQYLNKPESIKDGDIEEEIMDCEMHFHILKHYFPISKEVREKKIKKFLESKDYNFYKEKFENNNQ